MHLPYKENFITRALNPLKQFKRNQAFKLQEICNVLFQIMKHLK